MPLWKAHDWPTLRRLYETGDRTVTMRKLAKDHGVSPSTLMQKAARDKWRKRVLIAQAELANVEAQIERKAIAKLASDLAPWIEKQKNSFVRKSFGVATRGLSRVQRIQRKRGDPDPRDEANTSKAAETYVRIGRVSLGMTDGQSPQQPLSISLLGSHSAVQIVTPSAPNEGDTGE